jgi:multiple sugar transport system substrate-binding protein
VLDWIIPLETAADGAYVSPESPSVAGMAFKRDLAKQYFGTDDPLELEKLFPDWDAFKDAGAEVYRKSGGKVFMMTSLGAVFQIMKGQTSTPFVIGRKLNLEASMKPLLEQVIDFKKKNVVDIIDFDSPEEGASYSKNEHIFYPCATWSVVYTIQTQDKDGLNRWGFMLPPGGPFPWGGTVYGVTKSAKNKAAAVEYLKYYFGSERGATLQRDIYGNFTPYKPVYQNVDFYTYKNPYFRDQDVLKDIAQRVMPNVKDVRVPNEFDQDIQDVLNLYIKTINASTGGNINADQLITRMKDDLVNKNPELQK